MHEMQSTTSLSCLKILIQCGSLPQRYVAFENPATTLHKNWSSSSCCSNKKKRLGIAMDHQQASHIHQPDCVKGIAPQ